MMNRKKRSEGFSLIELLIVVTIILILAAIAIPKLLTVKQQANSTAAVANMKSMQNALTAFAAQYTSVGYPATLAALAGPAGAVPSATGAELVDLSLVTNPKQGYNFNYLNDGTTPSALYGLTADPASAGTGTRSFCTDQNDVIYYQDGTPYGAPTVSASNVCAGKVIGQ
ncbi:MAG: type II secretion system protein [Terriglobales bacterium]